MGGYTSVVCSGVHTAVCVYTYVRRDDMLNRTQWTAIATTINRIPYEDKRRAEWSCCELNASFDGEYWVIMDNDIGEGHWFTAPGKDYVKIAGVLSMLQQTMYL